VISITDGQITWKPICFIQGVGRHFSRSFPFHASGSAAQIKAMTACGRIKGRLAQFRQLAASRNLVPTGRETQAQLEREAHC